MKTFYRLFVKHLRLLIFSMFLSTITPSILQGKVDSLRNVELDEVQVFEFTSGRYVTEKPHRKNFKGLQLIEPSQLAVVFNQKELVFKKLSHLSICFTDNHPTSYVFRVAFYTVGKNGQPEQLIKTRELILMRQKSGWQDFYLGSENISIPMGGLAVVIYLMPQTKLSGLAVARVGMGKYKNQPHFYTRSSDKAIWLPVYQYLTGQGIAPMLQLSVTGQ
ncbi:MAG: hypothetical protein RL567_1099 [Bacteroidota bacterium]|jgi:hypothetical protein